MCFQPYALIEAHINIRDRRKCFDEASSQPHFSSSLFHGATLGINRGGIHAIESSRGIGAAITRLFV